MAKATYDILVLDHLPKQYESFIYSSWLQSLRFSNAYFKMIDSQSYYSTYRQAISKLLGKATIRLAVLSEDHDIILGYSITRGSTLDYVFVSKPFRKAGIGKALIPSNITVFTHITKIGEKIWHKHKTKYIFDPFNY